MHCQMLDSSFVIYGYAGPVGHYGFLILHATRDPLHTCGVERIPMCMHDTDSLCCTVVETFGKWAKQSELQIEQQHDISSNWS